MCTRPIHPEAAGLSDSIEAKWRDVRKATTGNFATEAALEAAHASLGALLNSGTTELRLLRQRIASELATVRAAKAERVAA